MRRVTRPPTCGNPAALQSEVARLDGIAGVLLQTGLAAIVGAFTVISAVKLSSGVKTVLIVAACTSVIATLCAVVCIAQTPSFNGLTPTTGTLEYVHKRKRRWCNASLIILSATIEAAAALVAILA
jgi:hypothetical protein